MKRKLNGMLSRLRPHIPGLAFITLTLLVGFAAMNNQNNMLFWVFGVLVAVMLISLLMASAIVRTIEVRRIDPHFGAVGEPLVMRYALRNRSRWLCVFNLHIAEHAPRTPRTGLWRQFMKPAAAWVMHVGPREIVHGEAVFWPTARGQAGFDRLRIHSTFPFGIIRRGKTISQPQHTLIYPMLYEMRRGVLASIAPMGLMGSRIAHHAGAGDDYFGLREHRPGDSLRHISWKRTARNDQLVTVERTSPAPAKLRIMLDLTAPTASLPTARGDRVQARQMEERAISLAASIIHAADLDGFEVGLSILGLDVPPIAVRRNAWHFHKMMAALAQIDLDEQRLPAPPASLRDAERVGLVVISPDRVQPLPGREDAWYLTGAHLEKLSVRPIGWSEHDKGIQASRYPGIEGISTREPSMPRSLDASMRSSGAAA